MATLANKLIYIGRESSSNKLHIVVTGSNGGESKSIHYGEPNSVNNGVSRLKIVDGRIVAHCCIEIDNNEKMLVKNLKEKNVTYADYSPILQRRVDEDSQLELGEDRYSITVGTILKLTRKVLGIPEKGYGGGNGNRNGNNNGGHNHGDVTETISVRHLEKVWNTYHDGSMNLKKKSKRTQTNRMMLMMFGSGFGSVIVGLLTSSQSLDPAISAVITCLPTFVIGLIIFLIMANDNSIDEEDRINNEFIKDYVCPHCGKHLGRMPYEQLPSQLPQCPRCKSEFTF